VIRSVLAGLPAGAPGALPPSARRADQENRRLASRSQME